MKKTDILANMLASDIRSKDILEVACGAAGFSVSAAPIAHRVSCIDLDDSRLDHHVRQSKIRFQIMDAASMLYPDDAFDTVVLFILVLAVHEILHFRHRKNIISVINIRG